MKFKIGDRVKIVKESQWYRDNRDNRDNNPKDIDGEIYEINISMSMPFRVRWSNNKTNCYYESDLELVDMIDIMNMEEIQQYKVLKDFNGQKVGDIIKVVDLNATVQWKDTNNFLVQTTVQDLLKNGFIELSTNYRIQAILVLKRKKQFSI